MTNFWAILTHPATLAVMAAIVTFALMKADCKVSREDKSTSVYCKNILLVSALVGAAAYIIKTWGFAGKKMTGGGINIGIDDIQLEPDF